MKFLIIAFFITSSSTYAFDILLTENNSAMDIQTLVDSGATAVNCEMPNKTPFPRCILKLGSAEVGIQNEGQSLEEVSFMKHQKVDTALRWHKKLKEEGICN